MRLRDKLRQRVAGLKQELPAVCLALRQKDTPFCAKLLAALTVAYALSPVDLIPDFIPVLGYLDDLLLLPALVALTVRLIPADILARCRAEAAQLPKGKKKWYYALPIICFWLLIAALVVRCIWF